MRRAKQKPRTFPPFGLYLFGENGKLLAKGRFPRTLCTDGTSIHVTYPFGGEKPTITAHVEK